VLVLGQDVFYHSTPTEVEMGLQPTFAAKVQWADPNGTDVLVSILTQAGWTEPTWKVEGYGPGQVSALVSPPG
jgi:hypothetical protein